MKRFSVALLISLFAAAPVMVASQAWAVTKVPPGNRSATQPKIPSASKSRTSSTKGSFQAKYEKIRDLIATDKKLQAKIKKAARQYGIKPIHIVGALVGEHTYNVDAVDRLQELYLKAVAYLNEDIKFAHGKENITKFVERPEFKKCESARDSYDLWSCRETIWKAKFQGKKVDGVNWPDDRFSRVFFQPFYAGQTFGLGQINPLTALRVTDIVAKTSGKPKLSASKPNKVYEAIIDPDTTLIYMAAVIKVSIDSYRQIAGFDISNNPGITATLYNLGNVRGRAGVARARGSMPRENYYGWLVNEKRSELEAILK